MPRATAGVRGARLSQRISGHFSRRARALAAFGGGTLLAAATALLLIYTWPNFIAIAFALFGLTIAGWFVYHGGRDLLTTFTPTSIIEVSSTNLRLGERLRVFVQQPGPTEFESYRVELLCVQQRMTSWQRPLNGPGMSDWDSDDGERVTSVTEHEHHTHVTAHATLLSESNATAPFERMLECEVPPSGQPSGGSERHSYWWVLRARVNPKRGMAFDLEFPMEVTLAESHAAGK